jgi:hypothetical protein
MEPRLLSIADAATYLGVARKTLGRLPVSPIRLGDRVLYDRRALDAWIARESGERKAEKPDDPALEELLARRRRKAARKAQGG